MISIIDAKIKDIANQMKSVNHKNYVKIQELLASKLLNFYLNFKFLMQYLDFFLNGPVVILSIKFSKRIKPPILEKKYSDFLNSLSLESRIRKLELITDPHLFLVRLDPWPIRMTSFHQEIIQIYRNLSPTEFHF